jgi:hypothetical protein
MELFMVFMPPIPLFMEFIELGTLVLTVLFTGGLLTGGLGGGSLGGAVTGGVSSMFARGLIGGSSSSSMGLAGIVCFLD